MKGLRIHMVLVMGLGCMIMPISLQGQFLKKLKKKVENKIVNKASEKTDELLNGEGAGNDSGNVKNTKETDNGTIGDNASENGSNPTIQDNNIITHKAPNKDFIDIVIQSHKGLPRYGDVYYLRGKTASTNSKAYKALLELKYMKELLEQMDKSKLTTYNYAQNDTKTKYSNKAQHHLLMLGKDVLSDKRLQEYFCDAEAQTPCNFYNTAGERSLVPSWGGTRNNEFAQNRSYTAFIQNHLEALEAWSNTFFPNDEQIAYFVARGAVNGKYDFKNKGYWIRNIFSIGGDFMLHNTNFMPYTENEKTLRHSSKSIFLPVEPSKAKEYALTNVSPVFVAFKVKVFPKIIAPDQIQWEFQLEDSNVEFYKDGPLSQKLGEVDMKTVTFKD